MPSVLTSKRYSFRELAKLLNVHIATVWRWHLHGVRGRKLPAVLIGARRYVLAADLERFLSAGDERRQLDANEFRRRADDAGKMLDAKGVGKPRGSDRAPRQ